MGRTHTYPPTLEIAFYIKEKFIFYSKPDYVFILNDCDNCPPYISLLNYIDKKNTNRHPSWKIYDEDDVYSTGKGIKDLKSYRQDILKICLLMLGIYCEKEKDINEIATAFYDKVVEDLIIDTYRIFNHRQVQILLKFACEKLSSKYRVLCYSSENDIIQDMQPVNWIKFEQFRHQYTSYE